MLPSTAGGDGDPSPSRPTTPRRPTAPAGSAPAGSAPAGSASARPGPPALPPPGAAPPGPRPRPLELSVIQRSYDLALWAIPLVERFPRSQRDLLGDRLQTSLHDLVEGLVEAKYTPAGRRGPLLDRANLLLTRLRLQLRLAKDLGHLRERSYLHAAQRAERIGRELGGWRRQSQGPGAGLRR